MLINKIKINKNGSVHINYKLMIKDDPNTGEVWNTLSLTSDERPASGFNQAFIGLMPHVTEICELPVEDEDNLRVNGARFTYSGDANVMGVQIFAEKILAESETSLMLKTPHKLEQSDNPKKQMSRDCVEALRTLIEEAFKYINGERGQIEMNLTAKDGEAAS